MSKKDKLLKKLFSRSKDFTYKELKTLMESMEYKEFSKGKTSGSRVAFINKSKNHITRLHKPHPKNVLKQYQIDFLIAEFKKLGLFK